MNIKLLLLLPFLLIIACKKDDDENEMEYAIENDLVTLTTIDNELKENSGLVTVDGKIWTHNDSGGEAKIYRIEEDEEEIDKRVNITNALNIDWEDITQDETHLYIGDFGNNGGERQDLAIYKVLKSNLPDDTEAEVIRFIYSDQTDFDNANNLHDFDCEAIISVEDQLYLFSKNHVNKETKVYQIPKTPGTHVAQRISVFDTDGLISGAEYNKNTNTLCLLGYNTAGVNSDPFVWIFHNFTGTDFFGGDARRVNLNIQAQMEGISTKGDGKFYISSEDENGSSPTLFLFDADKWK